MPRVQNKLRNLKLLDFRKLIQRLSDKNDLFTIKEQCEVLESQNLKNNYKQSKGRRSKQTCAWEGLA